MKRFCMGVFSIALGLSILVFGGALRAQQAPQTPPVGLKAASASDDETALVSLTITEGTVGDALVSISKQAGWGLVMSVPKEMVNQPLTLMLEKKPAKEVLETIASSTNLKVELKNGVLHVTGAEPASPPVAAAPPAAAQEDTPTDDDDKYDKRGWRKRFREKMSTHFKWDKDHFKQRKLKSRVEIGGSVEVPAEDHVKEAVAVGGSNTVYGHVEKDAVAIGGGLTIKSGAVVEGSAVAIGGDVSIEDGAVVEDEAVSVGGQVQVAEGALLEGDRVSIGVPLPSMTGLAGAIGGLMVMNAISGLLRSVFLFVIALLLIWLVPQRLENVKAYLMAKPGASILTGFVLCLAMIPLIILLAITIIGIPLIPVAVVGWAVLFFIGFAAFFLWFGEKIPVFKNKNSALLTLTVGFVAFALINVIPFIGGLFLFITSCAASGAALQTRFGKRGPDDAVINGPTAPVEPPPEPPAPPEPPEPKDPEDAEISVKPATS